MAKTRVINPATAGRLMVVNKSGVPAHTRSGKPRRAAGRKPNGRGGARKPAARAGKRRNGVKTYHRPRNNPAIGKDLVLQIVAAAIGGALTKLIAGKLSNMIAFLRTPVGNIGAKLGAAYGLSWAAEKISFTKPYANAALLGGGAIAATDAFAVFVPGLRTFFVPASAPVAVNDEGAPAEIAGYWDEELGDVVYTDAMGNGMGDVLYTADDGMGDVINPGIGSGRYYRQRYVGLEPATA